MHERIKQDLVTKKYECRGRC